MILEDNHIDKDDDYEESPTYGTTQVLVEVFDDSSGKTGDYDDQTETDTSTGKKVTPSPTTWKKGPLQDYHEMLSGFFHWKILSKVLVWFIQNQSQSQTDGNQ